MGKHPDDDLSSAPHFPAPRGRAEAGPYRTQSASAPAPGRLRGGVLVRRPEPPPLLEPHRTDAEVRREIALADFDGKRKQPRDRRLGGGGIVAR